MDRPTIALLRRIQELAARRQSSAEIAAAVRRPIEDVERLLGHRGMVEGIPLTAAMETIDSNRQVIKGLMRLARSAEADKDRIAALLGVSRVNAGIIAAARFLHQAGVKAHPVDDLPEQEQAELDLSANTVQNA